ncbi:MAG TPA: YcnI family protein, partial [Nocardioidaceae bacterium]|nr:YcnI family protein [Nocardioidaceae bacterium]
ISPDEATAGEYAVLTASVGHGCDGSATTVISIEMPEQVLSVTPTRNPFWTVKKVMVTLPEPVTDAHGNEVTERVGQVVYQAKTPLPDGYRDAFALSLRIPDVPGESLVFPVVQKCEVGETAWIELATEGAEEPDHPAPVVAVLAGDGSGHHGESSAAPTTAQAEDGDGLGLVGLGAGLVGLVLGAAAFVQVRRRT